MNYDETDILHIKVSGYTKETLRRRALEAAKNYFGHTNVLITKMTPTVGEIESHIRDSYEPFTAEFAATEIDS